MSLMSQSYQVDSRRLFFALLTQVVVAEAAKDVSKNGRDVSQTEREVSYTGRAVSQTGREVSQTGREVSKTGAGSEPDFLSHSSHR